MIVQLNCSMSWSKGIDGALSPTGGLLPPDSVLISIEDLKVANAKILELKYEKEINKSLTETIHNDSILIGVLNRRVQDADERCERKNKRIKTQRNILGGVSVGSLLLLIISIL